MPVSATALVGIAAAVLLAAAARAVAGFLRFRAELAAALGAAADIDIRRATPWALSVTVAGFPLRIHPIRLYLRDGPASADRLVRTLRARVPPAAVPPFALVRDRILPVLKRDGTLPPADGYVPENRVIRRTFPGGIVIAYVIEGQFRVTYLTDGMLDAWELPPDVLHGLALQNLRAKTRHLLDEIGGPRRDYIALDGFDAARLLVADLLIPPDLADPVLAIPHEHALMIRERAAADGLRQQASWASQRATLPLTAELYELTSAGPLPATRAG